MISWLIAGGPVMVPIGACSIVAVAVLLERSWALRRDAVLPKGFLRELREQTTRGSWDDALDLARSRRSAAARLALAAIAARHEPPERLKSRLEEVGRREAAELERFVSILATCASVAPLLGLLGTVGGMILTFDAIGTAGPADQGALAVGISQALITTFGGLVVAIPSVIAHRYLLGRVDDQVLELEEFALRVVELVEKAPKR